MRPELRSVILVIVLAVALVGMWYQTFKITGVTAQVAPAQAERMAPPAPPRLTPLATETANVELFGRAHPAWSAFSS